MLVLGYAKVRSGNQEFLFNSRRKAEYPEKPGFGQEIKFFPAIT